MCWSFHPILDRFGPKRCLTTVDSWQLPKVARCQRTVSLIGYPFEDFRRQWMEWRIRWALRWIQSVKYLFVFAQREESMRMKPKTPRSRIPCIVPIQGYIVYPFAALGPYHIPKRLPTRLNYMDIKNTDNRILPRFHLRQKSDLDTKYFVVLFPAEIWKYIWHLV